MTHRGRPPIALLILTTLAFTLTLAALAPALAGTEAPGQDPVDSAVVKIFVRSSPPDLLSPWQKEGLQGSVGSGVILESGRILTNAHVVDHAVSIEVKRAGMSERFVAEVEQIGHECDLALLTVEEQDFFEGSTAIQTGETVRPQDEVQVYGFPLGGDNLSVTSGIVSRVEVSMYAHSMEDLLLAQIDAAINPGNSGGPVLVDDRLVGIATQSLDKAENVGYMVPVQVIRHFLADVEDGRFDGFPRLGADLQDLESRAHRESLGMDKQDSGALVTRIAYGSPAASVLQPGDVLLSLGGYSVANDMTVAWGDLGRVDLRHVIHTRQIGETLPMAVLREGRRVDAVARLTFYSHLVPMRASKGTPDYYVFGGVVFQTLTLEYLTYFEKIPGYLETVALDDNLVRKDRREVILIQKVLPNAVNRGYQDWEDKIVVSVNGKRPTDLSHLARIIDAADTRWLTIGAQDGSRMILDTAAARAAGDRILSGFGIASDRSLGSGPAGRDGNRSAGLER